MELIIISFIAGVLTVLSPCVLPLLPIVLGGSVDTSSKRKPIIITISLAISIIVFTLVLKSASSIFNFDENFLSYLSGGLILLLGLITLFPKVWEKITVKLKLSQSSQELLTKSAGKKGDVGSILTGASLGPVFSSCSPTYALILATVLPQSFATGFINLVAYSLGLSLFMLLIAIFGQKLISKVKFAANPNGWFRKLLGIIFVLVGLLFISGYNRDIQDYMLKNGYFDATRLEKELFKDSNPLTSNLDVEEPYEAPDFVGNSDWINSDPLSISALRGKVVLVDFWTYSCINCIRTLEYLTAWDEKYRDDGLVIVGVHSPEFNFEKELENVQKAVNKYDIKYPVALDNDFDTWRAYKNNAWPTKYFIDREGKVRSVHLGEGDYLDNEKIIRMLLAEDGTQVTGQLGEDGQAPVSALQTAETYLGYARGREVFANEDESIHDEVDSYEFKDDLDNGVWTLEGEWNVGEQDTISASKDAKLRMRVSAKDIYLVMGSETDSNKRVKISLTRDGKEIKNLINKNGNLTINEDQLYEIASFAQFERDIEMTLTFDEGVRINAFTFGSK